MKKGRRLATNERKAQVLVIASRIFCRDGYEKGSLNTITGKAGITKAAIYYHFKNKEEILYSIILGTVDRLIFGLKEISMRKDDPINELKEMIDVQVSYMSENMDATKIVFEEMHFLSKTHQGIVRDKQKEIIEIYKTKLEEIGRAGKLRDVSITTAKFSILGIMIWLYQWYNSKGKLSMKKIKDDIINIVLSGVIKEYEKEQVRKKK